MVLLNTEYKLRIKYSQIWNIHMNIHKYEIYTNMKYTQIWNIHMNIHKYEIYTWIYTNMKYTQIWNIHKYEIYTSAKYLNNQNGNNIKKSLLNKNADTT